MVERPTVTDDAVDEWIRMFPLQDFTGYDWHHAAVNSAKGLAKVLQIRSLAAQQPEADFGEPVACDVFLHAVGEPPRRDVTKIGGLPYRPAGKPWPTFGEGLARTFLAQFCFRDSLDIVGKFPGDILLIFTQDNDLYWPDDGPEPLFLFEWYPLGLTDLIQQEMLPPQPWKILPRHGYRYRTQGYPSVRAAESVAKIVAPHIESRLRHLSIDTARAVCELDGAKIGRIPHWPSGGSHGERVIELAGRHLCTLTDHVPDLESPYPWVNHPEPDTTHSEQESRLLWRDGAVINFSIDEQGQMDWAVRFH